MKNAGNAENAGNARERREGRETPKDWTDQRRKGSEARTRELPGLGNRQTATRLASVPGVPGASPPSMSKSYTKISGGGLLLSLLPGLRTKLYLGPDHLLLIEQFILTERYKRFYFRDIQAITATKSARWIVFGLIWGFLVLLSALFFIVHTLVTLIFGALFTVLFGFAFIHNIVSGPTCIVRLQTAVQTHRVAPLERIRDFRKGMRTIVPLIQNAQRGQTAATIILVLALILALDQRPQESLHIRNTAIEGLCILR